MLYQSQPNQLLLTALKNRYRTAGIDSPVTSIGHNETIERPQVDIHIPMLKELVIRHQELIRHADLRDDAELMALIETRLEQELPQWWLVLPRKWDC